MLTIVLAMNSGLDDYDKLSKGKSNAMFNSAKGYSPVKDVDGKVYKTIAKEVDKYGLRFQGNSNITTVLHVISCFLLNEYDL